MNMNNGTSDGNDEENELRKLVHDLQSEKVDLDREVDDAKTENAKLATELQTYERLIDLAKTEAITVTAAAETEKAKLDAVQMDVWQDLQYFSADAVEMLNDTKFEQISNDCEADLREMEREIVRLSGELESMKSIAESQERTIEEIKRITRKKLDDLEGN